METPSSPLTSAVENLLAQHGGPLSINGTHGDYVVMRSDVYEQMLGLSEAGEAETLAAVKRGLADLDAGRTVPLDEAMKELRSRHGA
ncbi:hypothetical protein [Lacipirellula sp.]|jgi:hypothetical protein|uniref:hypothetical protein n=1 Tax=Lacipirellula sp. TaxID=2691419 RepID=UPI003D0EDB9D